MISTLRTNPDRPVSSLESAGGPTRLAAASRDGHLALRRVERQQALIERLHAAHGGRIALAEPGPRPRRVGAHGRPRRGAPAAERRAAATHPGRGGGVSLPPTSGTVAIEFDLPEAAALMSSLAVLGPTVSPSAASAMRKLAAALAP